MVFAVSPGDGRLLAAREHGGLFRRGVIAVKRDRGRIVVQLVQRHAKLANGAPHDGQNQSRRRRREQPRQAGTEPVVVQQGHFAVIQAEQVG